MYTDLRMFEYAKVIPHILAPSCQVEPTSVLTLWYLVVWPQEAVQTENSNGLRKSVMGKQRNHLWPLVEADLKLTLQGDIKGTEYGSSDL